MPILDPLINIIAERVSERVLSAKKVGSRILYEAEAIDAAVRENKTFKYKRVQ